MDTFKIRVIALCGLLLAALAGAQPAEPDCLKEAKLRIPGHDEAVTLEEAEEIRKVVEEYLEEEKPALEPSVIRPGKAFVDCWGTIRLGAWILESGSSEKPELDLTFRVETNERFVVRQVVGLELVEGRWKVTGVGVQTAHLRY